AIRMAIVLSLLVHGAALWRWPLQIHHPSTEMAKRGETSGPLVVHLAPPASPPPAAGSAPALEARQAPPLPARIPKAAPRARPSAPVIALNQPSPATPSPTPTPNPTLTP